MSIEDIVDGIGNFFSSVWEGIKDLFYQLYTSEFGIWIIVAMIVLGVIIGMIDNYEISKIMKKRPQWMKDKEKTLKDNPEMFDEEGNISPDFDFVEEAIKLMPDDKEYLAIAKKQVEEKKDMKEFFKNFSEEEKDFIVKEFISWQTQGLVGDDWEDNIVDDVIETVMELAINRNFANREDTCEMVFNAYNEFINMEFTEIEE